MDNLSEIEPENKKDKNKIFNILFLSFCCFILLLYFLFTPLNNKDTVIHVQSGQSISSLSLELKNENIIRSTSIFNFLIKSLKKGSGIITGDYMINKNSSIWVVAWQVSRGHHNIESIKVTVREGLTNQQIANLLADKLPNFNKDLFLFKASDKQGYLFPDTYFFFPLDTVDEIIEQLFNNFNNKIKNINSDIEKSNKKLSDIITMASILEWEAKGKEDIQMISGILWKRISIGMPLQVDVDKSTYKNKGLPSVPLNNPGLLSINASINPVNSAYLYYLHDKSGKAYFATTFEEHKSNISKYLK